MIEILLLTAALCIVLCALSGTRKPRPEPRSQHTVYTANGRIVNGELRKK